ncbi:MAG: hypothetical protein ACNS62_14130 [Candidatus Cyclobacteriaceae bacterium M3_2C_046]
MKIWKYPFYTIIMLISACAENDENQVDNVDREPPLLKNLIVTFDNYDPDTQTAGDFIFQSNYNKMFLEFGALAQGPDGPKILPTFEYILDENALVLAPCDGLITRLDFRYDSQDYSMIIKNQKNSIWFVNVDHIKNITVQEGDRLAAGEVIGNPGNWNNAPGLGRVELSVINDEERRNYCPFSFFDPALKSAYEAKVLQLMTDWETFKNDFTIYDQENMTAPACKADWYDTN